MCCEWLFPWGPPVQTVTSHLSSAYTMWHQCRPCVSWHLAWCCLFHYSSMPWANPYPKKWQHHKPCLRLRLFLSVCISWHAHDSLSLPKCFPFFHQGLNFLRPHLLLVVRSGRQAVSPHPPRSCFCHAHVSLSHRGGLRVSGNRDHAGAGSARWVSSEK